MRDLVLVDRSLANRVLLDRSLPPEEFRRHYRTLNREHAHFQPRQIYALRGIQKDMRRTRLPILLAFSRLEAVIFRHDGTRIPLGTISKRVITNAGVAFMVDAFQNLVEMELMNFHGMGTGAVAEAVGDTALGTEVETRATGTQSEPSSNQYRTLGTNTATGARAVTEHGIFSASTAGVLLDRSVFSVINLATSDSIQFTYTITLTAGG
jgi:hypothetical protein